MKIMSQLTLIKSNSYQIAPYFQHNFSHMHLGLKWHRPKGWFSMGVEWLGCNILEGVKKAT